MLDEGVSAEQDLLPAFINAAAPRRMAWRVDHVEPIPLPIKLRAVFKNRAFCNSV